MAVTKTSQQISSTNSDTQLTNDENLNKISSGKLNILVEFLGKKLLVLRNKKIRYSDVKICVKSIRKSIRVKRTPKDEGYGRLVTDEEKRFQLRLNSFTTNLTTFFFTKNRWMDEYTARDTELSSRIGIPYIH